MTIPDTIQFEQIVLGERGRTIYNKIEELAQSIKDNGLIQPLVLVPLGNETFGIDAGGRRYHAIKHLGYETLYHAVTSEVDKPGFVLKDEEGADPFKRLMTEIAENLDRDEMDWRDSMKLITKAYRLAKTDANSKGETILMRDFGAMLGVGYANLQAATAIHDDVIANPTRYKDCTGIRNAYTLLLKVNADEINRLAAAKSLGGDTELAVKVQRHSQYSPPVEIQDAPEQERKVVIDLSNAFKNVDGLDYLSRVDADSFDHIITDPDYAVSIELLQSNMSGASEGVAQTSTTASLKDLENFVVQSWRCIRPQGFLVFFYDLDHHEKLQTIASKVGFSVQRWPLIWHKLDYRSNAAPAHNFCKNLEYAMVCRKPNAVLSRAQTSSIYSCASGGIVKELGHPFAKPYELWTWIYSAVAIKGQTVEDPFAGSGSSSIAAMRWGLRPTGQEIDHDHYSSLIMNLQNAYKKELGSVITFK